jgi:hypothetical protein
MNTDAMVGVFFRTRIARIFTNVFFAGEKVGIFNEHGKALKAQKF